MHANRFKTLSILAAAAGLLAGRPAEARANPVVKVVIADESYQEAAGCKTGCNRGDEVFYGTRKTEVARKLDSGRVYFQKDGGISIASFGDYRDGDGFVNAVNDCLRDGRQAQVSVEKLPSSSGLGRLADVVCDPHRVTKVQGLHLVHEEGQACSEMSADCYPYRRDVVRDAQGQEPSFLHYPLDLDLGPLMKCVDAGKTADAAVDLDARSVAVSCK